MERIFWPFDPDWQSGLEVSHGYRTDIIVSRSGLEQRRANRTNPRRTHSASYVFDGGSHARFQQILATAQNHPFVVPDLTRSVMLTSPTTLGALPFWLSAGTEVVVIDRAANSRRVAMVSGVNGTALTFAGSVTWGAGAEMHPALTCSLAGGVARSLLTGSVATARVTFEVEPGTPFAFQPPTSFFDGRLLFPLRPNWANPVTVDHVWPVNVVDYGSGRIARHRPIDFPAYVQSAGFLAADRTAIETLLGVFATCRGRRNALWFSSEQDDLSPTTALQSASAQVAVAGSDVAAAFNLHPVHRAIEIEVINGTRLRRGVASITEAGVDQSVLQLTSPVGVDVPLGDIARISWLYRGRFASDDLTVRWITDTVADAKVNFQSLPVTEAPSSLALRVTPEGDFRETVSGDDRAVIYFEVPNG